MTDTSAAADRHVRPFAEWLRTYRHGALHDELSDALNELADAVYRHGKAGELTVTLKLKPTDSRPECETVLVSDQVRLKAPEPTPPQSLWYVDGDANLTRSDPRQPELPIGPRPVKSEEDTGT